MNHKKNPKNDTTNPKNDPTIEAVEGIDFDYDDDATDTGLCFDYDFELTDSN